MALRENSEPAVGLRNGESFMMAPDADAVEIDRQLDRVLASPAFRNSKRSSDLLAYLVRRALNDAEAGHLKERTIGIEVFGRAPDYDTTADHVVRSTAGEVRKRLAQYYMEPGHAAQIRIDVPSGSYVARFQAPSVNLSQEPGDIAVFAPVKIEPRQAGARRMRPLPITALAVFAVAAVLTALGIGIRFSERSGSALDRFWRPVLSSRNPILLCIGNWDQPHGSAQASSPQTPVTDAGQPMTLRDFHSLESQKVFLNDAIALANLTALLQGKGRRFRIVPHAAVTFADLQSGPAVLIGRRSNDWTGSLASQVRFSIEHGAAPHTMMIRDKRNPSRSDWSIDTSTPYLETTRDYALIVRVMNPKAGGQMAVMASGLTAYGTLAAGEFLTNPAQLEKLEAYAPRSWDRKNMAIVISADVIKASVGSPTVVAADFW